jgi:aromatase
MAALLRVWTTRHTIRVAAPPKRVFQLIAHVDRWPRLFDTLVAVEHIGFNGTSERIRFWKKADGALRSWISARELNPKRLQVRFRQEDYPQPLVSMGGLWLVVPKGSGSVIALDHYYRVTGDDAVAARHFEEKLDAISTSMLQSLRHNAERGGQEDDLWLSFANRVNDSNDAAEGVYPL